MKFKKIHLSVFVAIIVGICMASEMDDVKKEYKDLVHATEKDEMELKRLGRELGEDEDELEDTRELYLKKDPYWFGRRRRRTRFLHSASKFFRIIKHGFKGTYHRIKSHWEQGDFENHSHQTSANSSLHKSKRQDLSRESSTEKKLEKKSKDDIETDMEKLEKLLKE